MFKIFVIFILQWRWKYFLCIFQIKLKMISNILRSKHHWIQRTSCTTQSWENPADCPLEEVHADTLAVLHDEAGSHPDAGANDGPWQVNTESLVSARLLDPPMMIEIPLNSPRFLCRETFFSGSLADLLFSVTSPKKPWLIRSPIILKKKSLEQSETKISFMRNLVAIKLRWQVPLYSSYFWVYTYLISFKLSLSSQWNTHVNLIIMSFIVEFETVAI